jgi:hypothetical protein
VPKPQWLFCQNTLVVRLGRRFVLDHPGCGQIADLAWIHRSTPAAEPGERSRR